MRVAIARRAFIAIAAVTSSRLPTLPASGIGPGIAAVPADLVTSISQLSTQARQLQLFVHEAAAIDPGILRQRVNREKRSLTQLVAYMDAAAPELNLDDAARIDAARIQADLAARIQADLAKTSLEMLDATLTTKDGVARRVIGTEDYPGGQVEWHLEQLCTAADGFLDIAAGRPLSPVTPRREPTNGNDIAAALVAPGPPVRTAASALRSRQEKRAESATYSLRRRASPAQMCASDGSGERLFGCGAELNLIYDSKCGVCQWEVDFLRARDADGRLTYTDLEAAGFEEGVARNGYLDYETALASFHAVTADGELLSGMPVFQAAYSAVGLGWVWRVYDNPLAAKLLDLGYAIFARYRTDLTRGSSLEALVAARRARARGNEAATNEECEMCAGRVGAE